MWSEAAIFSLSERRLMYAGRGITVELMEVAKPVTIELIKILPNFVKNTLNILGKV